jgi:hypothetical protein
MYKSEYLLGILLANMSAYVMIPVGLTLATGFSIICNCAIIRLDGILLRITLAGFSGGAVSIILLVLYVNSKLFELRKLALVKKRGQGGSKLFRRMVSGCRTFRMSFGMFYDIDHAFILGAMSGIINATANLLIVFH